MALVSKTFSEIITFTRASTATYFDSAGVLQSAAINAPRLDYNPSTLAAQGLLIEEQRTNSVPNSTATGSVAGTPGTLPTSWGGASSANGINRTVVGTGTENGIAYIDIQFSGTSTAGGSINSIASTLTGIAATSGQTWTGSSYVKLQAGSLTNLTSVVSAVSGRDVGGSQLETTQLTIAPTSAALSTQRNVVSRTLNNASTAFVTVTVFSAAYASGVAIDITLRIGLPQLELGAFATSVIPTSTVAVTRSADVASVNTLSPWYNATEGTLYSESLLTRQSATAGTNVFYIWNTSTSEIKLYYRGSGSTGATVVDATVNQADLTPTGVLTANTVAKLSLAYKANDFAAAGNGGAAVTDATGTVPAGMSQVLLGGPNGVLNGYIRHITYYPRRLSNAELQTITA